MSLWDALGITEEAEDTPQTQPTGGLWASMPPQEDDPLEGYLVGDVASELLTNTPPTGVAFDSIAYGTPPEYREHVANALQQRLKAGEGAGKKLKETTGGLTAFNFVEGAFNYVEPWIRRVGVKLPQLDPEQERFKQQLQAIQQGLDPTLSEEYLPRTIQQTASMALPTVMSVGAGKALGGAAGVAGLGATGQAIGQAIGMRAGVSGSYYPQIYDQTYAELIGEGVDPDTATTITRISAPIEAAIESIMPDPLSPGSVALRGSVRAFAGKMLRENIKRYGKELSEEALQGMVRETAMEAARLADEDLPNQGIGSILRAGIESGAEAAGPLALMMAPGASIQTAAEIQGRRARYERYKQLKEMRSKGYVSAEDGQAAGIQGATRKARLANADAEIQQLEEEIQNAGEVPEDQGVTEEAGEVGQRGEEDRGGDVRQAVEEQVEGGQAPEAQVEVDEALSDQPPAEAEVAARPLEVYTDRLAGLPESLVSNTPIRRVQRSEASGDYEDATVMYDHRTGTLHVMDESSPEFQAELENEVVAAWAWDNLTPEQYAEWRKAVGRPVSEDVQGGIGGGMSNVDDFAASVQDWLAGKPWGNSGPLLEKLLPTEAQQAKRMGIKPPARPETAVEAPEPAPPPATQQEAVQEPEAAPAGPEVEYTSEAATEAWIESQSDPAFIRRRESLVAFTRRLAKRLDGWKTADELTVKDRQGNRDAARTADTLKEMRATGHVQIAWDSTGIPYYAWGNEVVPKWLRTSTDEPQLEAAQEPEAAPTQTRERQPVRDATLEKAGITLTQTAKGWTVKGIPKEIADGLIADFKGQRLGKGGYFFRADPTEALGDAAREITEEAEQAAAAEASGLVRTSIGTLTPEQAEFYEQERQSRLAARRQSLAERHAAVDELLSNFVRKKDRGAFKLEIRRASEQADPDAIRRFDEMVDYSKEHPELGLPQSEGELFALLTQESAPIDDDAILSEIDAELVDEIERLIEEEAEGDVDFFDFLDKPTPKQTAIPGTEEAVARQERSEKSQQQFESKKGKQKAFISGLGKDLPGQETLFDVDGLEESAAESAEPPSPIQQAAEQGVEPETPAEFGKDPAAGVGIGATTPIVGQASGAGRSIQHFFQRFFTARGELPADVYDAKVRKEGRVAKEMNHLRFAATDFRRRIRKALGGKELTQADVEQMNAVLRGEAEASTVPEDVRAPLQAMRDHIDSLSRQLIAEGVAQGDLVGIITENLGVYATRSYRVFDDPKWRGKVPEGVRNRALAAIREMDPDKSDAEVLGILESLLFRGAADSPVALLKGSKLGSKDLSTFMKRKDVPEWLRELWGEYKDAGVNYARSVFKMSHLLANQQFLNNVKEAGSGKWLRTDEEGPIVNEFGEVITKIAADGSSVMAPLNGLYTTPEIKAAFERFDSPGEQTGLYLLYLRVNYVVKYGKTVGSMMTHIRNLISNTGFAVANGHWRLDKAGKAMWATATGTFQLPDAEFRTYYERLAELGLAGEDVRAGELKEALRDASQGDIDEFLYNREARHAKKAVKAGRSGLRFIEALYQAEDVVAKIYAWENEKARYAKAYPEWSVDHLEEDTAKLVRDTYPTYSKISEGVKKSRRFPVLGTFVSFPAEVVRTTFHTIRIGIEELQAPETREIGAQRLAGTVVAIGGLSVLSRAMMAMFGIGDDDDDDLRWFVPPWQENSRFIYTAKPENAKYRFVDLGYSDPHAYLTDSAVAFMRGDDWQESLWNSTTEVLRPFASEEILFKAVRELWSNEDNKIFNPKETAGEQAKASIWHLWSKALEPGTISSLRRIQTAASGTDPSKEVKTEVIALTTGQRLQKVDVEHSLGFRVRDFAKALTDIHNIARKTATSRGTATDEMVATDVARMEKMRLAEFSEMQRIVGAARRLGVPEKSILAMLIDELPDDVAEQLMTGDYSPYEMTPQTVQQMLQAKPDEFRERFSAWHGDKLPEAVKKFAMPKIGSLPTTRPKEADKAVKYDQTLQATKQTLDALGVSGGHAQRLLIDYYNEKHGGIYRKGSRDYKPSFEQRRRNLLRLYAEEK